MSRYFITDPAAADLTAVWQGHIDRGGTQEKADYLIPFPVHSLKNSPERSEKKQIRIPIRKRKIPSKFISCIIGIRIIDGLLAAFQTLADFPDIGTPRAYLSAGVLAFPHGKHMVFYRRVSYGVDIVRVLFGGMDFQAYFSTPEE